MTKKNKIIKRIKKLSDNWGFLLIVALWFLSKFFQQLKLAVYVLIIIHIIIQSGLFFWGEHSRLYWALKGEERWKRFKRIYHTQLLTERIITIMLIAVLLMTLFGISLQ